MSKCVIVDGKCTTDHAGQIQRGEVCSFCYQPGHKYEDHPVVRLPVEVEVELLGHLLDLGVVPLYDTGPADHDGIVH